ncbi:hypothetical protein QTI51_05845 [Variovorax sp. J22G73]|uniref:hypothetical protein n=1 Tax=unclassified Variovorax TaxID=663243 RepID=UPI001044A4C1|nr:MULTISPECIES: hypothetical protein [unclassified Variovorax]MDM0003543.1 hypothetical protein [Variovorax sp. J22R203]MDM0096791.1 hypothetical protein [Variovorax sp. J22G73]
MVIDLVVWPASLRAGRAHAATLNDVFANTRPISKVPAMVLEAPGGALRWCAASLAPWLLGLSIALFHSPPFLNLLEFPDVA